MPAAVGSQPLRFAIAVQFKPVQVLFSRRLAVSEEPDLPAILDQPADATPAPSGLAD